MPLLISLGIVGVVLCVTGLWWLLYARRNRQPTIKTRQEAIWALILMRKRRKR